jgi:hypothetical protein
MIIETKSTPNIGTTSVLDVISHDTETVQRRENGETKIVDEIRC